MKFFLKNVFLRFFRQLEPSLDQAASILAYHSVDDNPAFFTVKPEIFARQLDYLYTHHYQVVSLSQLIKDLNLSRPLSNQVVLTFDDGYLDNYEIVWPLLKKYNFPATIFVITSLIGEVLANRSGLTLPLMKLAHLQELKLSGLVEIMPHTHSHPNLDSLSPDQAIGEIEESRQVLEKLGLGTDQGYVLAYPRGRFTKTLVNHLSQAGHWLGAVTTQRGLITTGANPYLLKRNGVTQDTGWVEFMTILSRGLERFEQLKKYL